MAGDQEISVFSDSTGMFLAARPGNDPFRDAWLITSPADGPVQVSGPQAFARFLKFVPSDWEPAASPVPDRVGDAIRRLDLPA